MPQLSKRHEKSSEAYRPSDRYASLLFKEAGPFHAGSASMRINKNTRQTQTPRQPVGGSDLSGMVRVAGLEPTVSWSQRAVEPGVTWAGPPFAGVCPGKAGLRRCRSQCIHVLRRALWSDMWSFRRAPAKQRFCRLAGAQNYFSFHSSRRGC